MSAHIFATADWLDVDQNRGYGLAPIPSPRDDEIESLIAEWQRLDSLHRSEAAAFISEDQRFTLLAFSERMATASVRQNDPNRLHHGLLALGLDGWNSDWRENAAILCLYYDAARRLNTDPVQLFGKAGCLLSEKVGRSFSDFLARTDEDKALDAMGYVVGRDEDGFRYKRDW